VALVWQIKNIHQTFICQLAIFVLLNINCTVNSPNFIRQLVQQADLPNLNFRRLW